MEKSKSEDTTYEKEIFLRHDDGAVLCIADRMPSEARVAGSCLHGPKTCTMGGETEGEALGLPPVPFPKPTASAVKRKENP